MKKIALAAALTLAASNVFAGGYEEPVIEPVVVEEQTPSSGGGMWLPLAVFVVVGAAVAASN